MNPSPIELENLVRQHANELAAQIKAIGHRAHNEADIVIEMDKAFEKYGDIFSYCPKTRKREDFN
jgi:hypothetical protein